MLQPEQRTRVVALAAKEAAGCDPMKFYVLIFWNSTRR